MEANLYNLKPAIGEVNGDRANFAFAELPHVPPQHGSCPVRIDFRRKLAQPRAEIRGDIARIYFYMADQYQLQLDHGQQQLLLKWHQADPVDAREIQLNQRIAQQMGHPNYFVTGNREWYLGYIPSGDGRSVADNSEPAVSRPQPEFKHAPKRSVTANIHLPTTNESAVLGNKNSKVYHLQQCPGFSQVAEKNRRWFDVEQSAKDAGFRRAKNCPSVD
jgi:deoxyribonuclease-1